MVIQKIGNCIFRWKNKNDFKRFFLYFALIKNNSTERKAHTCTLNMFLSYTVPELMSNRCKSASLYRESRLLTHPSLKDN